MLSVILVLMIAAQPVQAGYCAMEPSEGAPQHMDMQHEGMQHEGMQHGGMQHEMGHDGASHDCCAAANPESGPGCDTLDQCGSCMAGTAAVPALNTPYAVLAFGSRVLLATDQVLPSHAAPPYRPPTTIS
jgi:hypothetical protein